VVSVLALKDVQDKPQLFSTFMLWMLARLYNTLPEVGDVDKPKLVFFFDEAHLLFNGASKEVVAQIEQTVRLVRSKGVGVFFVTQSPKDIAPNVLGQLGQRVQHALRAFTPDDEKALRAAARTFPKTTFYDVEETLTTLGIGDALVTVLSPSGAPTPPFVCRMIPPSSRMGPLTDAELAAELARSEQVAEYATPVDRDSARERLAARAAADEGARADAADSDAQAARTTARPAPAARRAAREAPEAPGTFERLLNSRTTQSVLRTAVGAITRGLMGALVGSPPRRSSRRRR
jgi:hypothetical protein